MNIIKPGKVPVRVEPLLQGTCFNCSCRLECTRSDEAILPYSRSNPVFIVNCPTEGCGVQILLEEKIMR
jgi:hypothetical protein